MARIKRPDTAFNVLSKSTKPRKDKDYLSWIRELPCLIDHTSPVDPAHLSTKHDGYGHLGRGKSQKASDRWALPLSRKRHEQQHSMNEEIFYVAFGINPWTAALTLHGLWSDMGDEATDEATRLIIKRKLGVDDE